MITSMRVGRRKLKAVRVSKNFFKDCGITLTDPLCFVWLSSMWMEDARCFMNLLFGRLSRHNMVLLRLKFKLLEDSSWVLGELRSSMESLLMLSNYHSSKEGQEEVTLCYLLLFSSVVSYWVDCSNGKTHPLWSTCSSSSPSVAPLWIQSSMVSIVYNRDLIQSMEPKIFKPLPGFVKL